MFRTHHRDFMRRKAEWFENITQDNYVLWWVPQTYTPSIEDGIERLNYLRANSDTPYAFTFRSNFSTVEATEYQKNKTIL
jgi:hypothetical protein